MKAMNISDEERNSIIEYYTQRRPLVMEPHVKICKELAEAFGCSWQVIDREIRKARRSEPS